MNLVFKSFACFAALRETFPGTNSSTLKQISPQAAVNTAPAPPASADPLSPFHPSFMESLERLSIRLRRRSASGGQPGDRKSRKPGAGLEFSGFRNYSSGDEPRHVDWSAYARTGRLFTKVFEGEEDLAVGILVDCSRSMRGDVGSVPKFDFARRLAAALGCLTLLRLDRINIAWFDAGWRGDTGFRRGRMAIHEVFQFLSNPPGKAGETSLESTARDWCGRIRWRGPLFLISDFLDPEGVEGALSLLTAAGFPVFALQVLSPEEWDPPASGEMILEDSETGETKRLLVDGELRKSYARAITRWVEQTQQVCLQKGAGYSLLRSEEQLEDAVVLGLRHAGILH